MTWRIFLKGISLLETPPPPPIPRIHQFPPCIFPMAFSYLQPCSLCSAQIICCYKIKLLFFGTVNRGTLFETTRSLVQALTSIHTASEITGKTLSPGYLPLKLSKTLSYKNFDDRQLWIEFPYWEQYTIHQQNHRSRKMKETERWRQREAEKMRNYSMK